MRHDKKSKLRFVEVFINQAVNVKQACDAFKISRKTFYEWMKEDWFREEIEAAREGFIDNVESALFKNAVINENVAAQIFILKTRGRSRGYVEKQVLEHRDRRFESLTDDELNSEITRLQSIIDEE